jgi:lipopolysaccharide export system protein LptA
MRHRTRNGVLSLSRKSLALILLGLLLTTLAVCQQVKRTRTAAITAPVMEYDWDKNVIEFTGGTKLVIGGGYDATMSAPSMNVRLSAKGDKVVSLVAAGPVNFTVVTKADNNGLRRKITASAKDEATYSEETQLLKLVGGAVADMKPLDAGEDVEAVHFTGKTITADLKTSRLKVTDADLTVKSQMEQ